MRIGFWNVNSVRARVERVIDFLVRHDVDVLLMQEIKCTPVQFPLEQFVKAGYEVVAHGLDQWNGVAVASRVGLKDPVFGFNGMPTFRDVAEARALGVTVGSQGDAVPVQVWSLYVPNGRELTHEHYAYKLGWLEALRGAAEQWMVEDSGALIFLGGDWNVAPVDSDVWDIGCFEGATHVSAAEREAFAAFDSLGLVEVTRAFTPGEFTYWDYKGGRFSRNEGMRIDFARVSPGLAARCVNVFIDRDEREGTGASDHAPVVVDFEF